MPHFHRGSVNTIPKPSTENTSSTQPVKPCTKQASPKHHNLSRCPLCVPQHARSTQPVRLNVRNSTRIHRDVYCASPGVHSQHSLERHVQGGHAECPPGWKALLPKVLADEPKIHKVHRSAGRSTDISTTNNTELHRTASTRHEGKHKRDDEEDEEKGSHVHMRQRTIKRTLDQVLDDEAHCGEPGAKHFRTRLKLLRWFLPCLLSTSCLPAQAPHVRDFPTTPWWMGCTCLVHRRIERTSNGVHPTVRCLASWPSLRPVRRSSLAPIRCPVCCGNITSQTQPSLQNATVWRRVEGPFPFPCSAPHLGGPERSRGWLCYFAFRIDQVVEWHTPERGCVRSHTHTKSCARAQGSSSQTRYRARSSVTLCGKLHSFNDRPSDVV